MQKITHSDIDRKAFEKCRWSLLRLLPLQQRKNRLKHYKCTM